MMSRTRIVRVCFSSHAKKIFSTLFEGIKGSGSEASFFTRTHHQFQYHYPVSLFSHAVPTCHSRYSCPRCSCGRHPGSQRLLHRASPVLQLSRPSERRRRRGPFRPLGRCRPGPQCRCRWTRGIRPRSRLETDDDGKTQTIVAVLQLNTHYIYFWIGTHWCSTRLDLRTPKSRSLCPLSLPLVFVSIGTFPAWAT
ncbi:hypothetical protein BDZ89DRAFT_368853 [Hymenopellis radicata]|nr:hypothetical protein BDZ89DRAFT_368853 [Hymenopellis radicata]